VLYNGSGVSSSADCIDGAWMGQPAFDSKYGLGTNSIQAVSFGSTWQAGGAGSPLPMAGN